jgi:hypothetical protein
MELGTGALLRYCFFATKLAEALADQALFRKQAHQGDR